MTSLRLTALAATLVLAACSSPTPTDPALSEPAAPSFDGGNTLGSGNVAGSSTDDGTVSSDSTGRGPGMVGSGN